ncbi:inovirus Gp2 family protein [Marinobacterium marinum]|uniref:Inovirus Gp2 family protein n=1 Tax=Marinobacterium marinum TaxID=2756129 RepID=A0A7W2ABB1_9GAMM|nr:inovirus Gp2 family protein [Marinobacterium marinum]MBA4500878.1 inovirus Gp2 family protein [Marinobacterium marinum]
MPYKKLTHNPNLSLFTQPVYRGLPVLASPEYPCVLEYLESAWKLLARTKKEYNRIYAVRIELLYPANIKAIGTEDNQVMERFKKALDSRVQWRSKMLKRDGKRVHPCRVRMIWAREQDRSPNPHYHLVLLLNRDRYFRLGSYDQDADNLYALVHAAWSSAIDLQTGGVEGFMHIPKNADYHLSSNDGYAAEPDLFKRISYLCKVRTKVYGERYHGFGVSRS